MHEAEAGAEFEHDTLSLGAGLSRPLVALRIATGLLQGVLLYWLYRASQDVAWPATSAFAMVPLVLLGLILPVLLISSLGHLKAKQASVWLLVALAVLLAMALHDAWRGEISEPLLRNWQGKAIHSPSAVLVMFSCVLFFIAHSLVLAGAQQGRRIASYGAYFETAWKLAIQLMFSVAFVGALFLVLYIGGELFKLIKLNFLNRLLQESWFNVPVVCAAFSCAMHITDVRPAIVRGIRTLLLVLMSWILPVAVIIVAGFLCSLPFTGLDALWQTRHATSVLLMSVALLVVLINAAFQNGEVAVATSIVVRKATRAAAIVIAPLTAIGVYALCLRVLQYGWTTDRIIAAACLLVAACYALGYVWAAYRYGTWLTQIAMVNVAAAFLIVAVLLALFTPIADPARIAVNNQMARLASGKTRAADVDFRYLRFEGGRYGAEALARLQAGGVGSGADAALLRAEASKALALKKTERWSQAPQSTAPASVAANIKVWPAGAVLPASFLSQKWELVLDYEKPACLSKREGKCEAFLLDVTGDANPEILLSDMRDGSAKVMAQGADGGWRTVGTLGYQYARCAPLLEKLRSGDFKVVESTVKDIEVGGMRLSLQSPGAAREREGCKDIK